MGPLTVGPALNGGFRDDDVAIVSHPWTRLHDRTFLDGKSMPFTGEGDDHESGGCEVEPLVSRLMFSLRDRSGELKVQTGRHQGRPRATLGSHGTRWRPRSLHRRLVARRSAAKDPRCRAVVAESIPFGVASE